jgi:uncharacterized protein (TIGR02284 family)
MSLPNSNVVSILKELMEVCKDGEQGYKDASDDIKDKELSVLLFDYSVQRGEFVNKLRDLVQTIGGDTEFTGSIMGILHRRWMDVKYGAAGSNPFSILTECLKGDSEVLKKYEIHLEQDLPDEIRQIVVQQHSIIKDNYDIISKLLEKHNLEIANN